MEEADPALTVSLAAKRDLEGGDLQANAGSGRVAEPCLERGARGGGEKVCQGATLGGGPRRLEQLLPARAGEQDLAFPVQPDHDEVEFVDEGAIGLLRLAEVLDEPVMDLSLDLFRASGGEVAHWETSQGSRRRSAKSRLDSTEA